MLTPAERAAARARSALAKAPAVPPPDPAAQARALLAQLGADLAHCDEVEGRVRRAAGAVHAHHEASAAGLAPHAARQRGSALEDAYLHHAQEARAARSVEDTLG